MRKSMLVVTLLTLVGSLLVAESRVLVVMTELLEERSAREPFIAKQVMSALEEAGFTPVPASANGHLVLADGGATIPVLPLDEVEIADYVGVIFPGQLNIFSPRPDINLRDPWPAEVALAQAVAATGLPIAAQARRVKILAEAGVLIDRRYSYHVDPINDRFAWNRDARFRGAVYAGNDSVVQDRNVITAPFCHPGGGCQGGAEWSPEDYARLDEFTNTFIAALRG